ncbi:hypothetical protein [Paraburkholderia sp. SIMBA_030]|uniref:hypothetical protein n=1 Tax=Paraburkholderia sp. SIMBA_030 TaxID=3085773 RepID=UPI00397BDB99
MGMAGRNSGSQLADETDSRSKKKGADNGALLAFTANTLAANAAKAERPFASNLHTPEAGLIDKAKVLLIHKVIQ